MTQVRKNFLTNIFGLVANVIVGLMYTPFLVEKLGVTTYGVLPIALVINQYIIIITDALQGSVTRFYSIEYRQKNYQKASVYFTSAIAVAVCLALLLLPVIGVSMPMLLSWLHIPDNLGFSVGKLILYTVAGLFVAVCSNCVNVTIYSDNRLDLINYLKIFRNLSKLGLNVLFFTFFAIDVSNVGLASLLTEIGILIASFAMYFYTRHEAVLIKWAYINFGAMKPVLKMLTWVSLSSFSSVFIYKIDTLFINNYFGLYYTGVLGSISEFGAYCISLTGVIGLLFRPLMLIAYSEKRHEDLVKITINGAYIVGIISSLLCGIVMGASASILHVWLNDEISHYSVWMMIKMLIIPITTYGSTVGIVNNLWNHVKSFSIWSLVIAAVYVGISLILLELGMGMIGFLVVGAIAAILQGAILPIMIYKEAYPQSVGTVYIQMMKCTSFFILVFVVTLWVDSVMEASNLFMLMIELVISAVLAGLLSVPFFTKQNIMMLDMVVPVMGILNKIKIRKQ